MILYWEVTLLIKLWKHDIIGLQIYLQPGLLFLQNKWPVLACLYRTLLSVLNNQPLLWIYNQIRARTYISASYADLKSMNVYYSYDETNRWNWMRSLCIFPKYRMRRPPRAPFAWVLGLLLAPHKGCQQCFNLDFLSAIGWWCKLELDQLHSLILFQDRGHWTATEQLVAIWASVHPQINCLTPLTCKWFGVC